MEEVYNTSKEERENLIKQLKERLQNENIQAQPNELKNLSNDVYFSHMVYEVEYPRLILYKANDTLMQKA